MRGRTESADRTDAWADPEYWMIIALPLRDKHGQIKSRNVNKYWKNALTDFRIYLNEAGN